MNIMAIIIQSPERLKQQKLLRKGPEGAIVIAVSDKNDPFEIMLPDEWEQRKAEFLKADSQPTTLNEPAKEPQKLK